MEALYAYIAREKTLKKAWPLQTSLALSPLLQKLLEQDYRFSLTFPN